MRTPLCGMLLDMMEVEHRAAAMAAEYFMTLIWGAPAMLGSFVMAGWFLGMQNSKVTMWISILTVIVNIAVSLTLTLALNLGIYGLPWARSRRNGSDLQLRHRVRSEIQSVISQIHNHFCRN